MHHFATDTIGSVYFMVIIKSRVLVAPKTSPKKATNCHFLKNENVENLTFIGQAHFCLFSTEIHKLNVGQYN